MVQAGKTCVKDFVISHWTARLPRVWDRRVQLPRECAARWRVIYAPRNGRIAGDAHAPSALRPGTPPATGALERDTMRQSEPSPSFGSSPLLYARRDGGYRLIMTALAERTEAGWVANGVSAASPVRPRRHALRSGLRPLNLKPNASSVEARRQLVDRDRQAPPGSRATSPPPPASTWEIETGTPAS